MPKRFTLAEAQSLIPSVDPVLRKAIELKSHYAEAEQEMESYSQRIQMMGGLVVNREQALEVRHRRDTASTGLREAIQEVEEFGCVLKDLDVGLIDFPTLFRGREVYLCWKLGEAAIAFWHGTDEGFAGRKAIDQDFRDHHKGDRSQ
ncbi:MAG TPA: DUF2203 domain-containing protein [Bryobacteraceae bacterium]|jgi:hypothetical protein|nr:DUF2203 domain-containing protein [Bryobacteraceae bacterium]